MANTKSVSIMAVLLSFCVLLSADPGNVILFPSEYRQWAHVKSALVGPQSPAFATEAGIHHIYANEKALEGYKSGKFPDGAIVVYDLLETNDAKGITIEGPQRRIDVMVKDHQRYEDTGGWGFARFWGSDHKPEVLSPDRRAECYRCHSQRKDHDAILSDFRK